jgi:hypothetical protein
VDLPVTKSSPPVQSGRDGLRTVLTGTARDNSPCVNLHRIASGLQVRRGTKNSQQIKNPLDVESEWTPTAVLHVTMDLNTLFTQNESAWFDRKQSFHASRVELLHDLLCLRAIAITGSSLNSLSAMGQISIYSSTNRGRGGSRIRVRRATTRRCTT